MGSVTFTSYSSCDSLSLDVSCKSVSNTHRLGLSSSPASSIFSGGESKSGWFLPEESAMQLPNSVAAYLRKLSMGLTSGGGSLT